MTTAAAIIEGLGGRLAVSEKLSIPYTTIDAWVKTNSIPHWRWSEITALADEMGKPVGERPAKRRAA